MKQSINYAYVNGQFVSEQSAHVSIFDRGFLYGDGVFETMRIYQGKFFRLHDHLQRLIRGAEYLKLGWNKSLHEINAILDELLVRNSIHDGIGRIYITRGVSSLGLSIKKIEHPTTIVLAYPREFATAPDGIRVVISQERIYAKLGITGVKTANRLPYVLAKIAAEEAGVDDAIMLNTEENVVEFTASNLFAVKNGELFTPPLTDGPLPGITRNLVLQIAAGLKIHTHVVSFNAQFLENADEIFATNSLIEILPVLMLNRHPVALHVMTKAVQVAYGQLMREELLL